MPIKSFLTGTDDTQLYRLCNDVSGGVNTRVHASKIADNQAVTLRNVELNTPGQRSKRLGYTTIADDVSNYPCRELANYVRQGYTDYLLLNEGKNLLVWKSGDASWTNIKNDLTATTYGAVCAVKESGLTPDDVLIYQNGTDHAWRVHIDSGGSASLQDLGTTAGTGSDSPPLSRVMCWYGNRLWVLKNDQLYFSDAYPADYSSAFDTVTNWYRIPVGTERALIPTRDSGIIVLGKEAIWSLAPSATPAATDQPQPLTQYGCVANKTAVAVGDDVYWLAQDGVRALKRTVQDKLQTGASYPVSFAIKDEIDDINWAYIEKACAVYFDNRYMLAVPTGSSTYNNKVYVYYPALNAWAIWDLPVGSFSIHIVNGEQQLYFGDAQNGQVYRMFSGTTDNTAAITYTEETRDEDFGQKLVKKVGGWIEVEAGAAGGSNTLTIEVAVDGGSYSTIGTLLLTADTAPVLPIALPFTLSDEYVIRDKFHLEQLGEYRSLKVRVSNTDANTDEIKVYSVNIVTFPASLEDE